MDSRAPDSGTSSWREGRARREGCSECGKRGKWAVEGEPGSWSRKKPPPSCSDDEEGDCCDDGEKPAPENGPGRKSPLPGAAKDP